MSGPIVLPPQTAPGFGWFPARDAITQILLGVTITDPIATTIKRVYPYRQDSETDFPCVVMPNPPGKRVMRGPSGYRDRVYVVTFDVLAADADVDREANILDALEEAIISAFDNAVTLGLFAGYHVVEGPHFEPAGRTQISDSSIAGIVQGHIVLKMVDGTNFIG